ncbi:guanylate cyclase [Vibrio sinaloensis]|uniref:heme NO-binding domain-containing protein n=1 Tax=Photobacterium sp. (strain ATCC 43367) TaxID=379097 RepID=UPI00057DC6AD|nr:heme NO-binding domain-containing protein [Vibrio sinaloensis]KIE19681.1 guanylate cyclase [Vibrio sinaloensis]
MKGIIFTEFIDLVEAKFGLDTLDDILESAGDDGVYTSVGSYDHRKLVQLVVMLSKKTGIPAEDLQRVFGQSVFNNLYSSLPKSSSLENCQSTFQFIRLVEDYIHTEVKKLYQDANPPRFDFISESETEMEFDYRSARCMAHVCLGLLEGCAAHFEQLINVEMVPQVEDGSNVRFKVVLVE